MYAFKPWSIICKNFVSSIRKCDGFSRIQLDQHFHYFLVFIFSKFLDGIKAVAPKHLTHFHKFQHMCV